MEKMSHIENWSRYPSIDAWVHTFRTPGELRELVTTLPTFIARGAGLSYGDASLAPVILSTLEFNKVLEFDREHGTLLCESGVTLDEILKIIVPAGWFLPVTPGTKFITLGGAVASDIHGKNHHVDGSISRFINRLTLMLSDGKIITCSRTENAEVFDSTCGGMGLSGVILEVELRLKKIQTSMIAQKNIVAKNLDELIRLLKESNRSTYSVAWIDCLARGEKMGRGVLMLGEHALPDELPHAQRKNLLRTHVDSRLKMHFDMPAFFLNRFFVRGFNALFYKKQALSKKEFIVHYDKFFYPLDFIVKWNKLYGKNGLLQYQFVVPGIRGEECLKEIVEQISKSGLASFLGVLKLLGECDHLLSFPMPGFTLALDFPLSPKLLVLLDRLDRIVVRNGGKLYLAKDARMKKEIFKRSYPGGEEFKAQLRKLNVSTKFESLLSRRLSIC